ncbi:MAG: CCxxC motif-containing NuoF prefix domain-containing protein, partial [Sedimentisphaerales bacterium]|nr:CCxxC motif-containing NuoF prefix domain-containing protein [Sedimentisphaerales bacterium]
MVKLIEHKCCDACRHEWSTPCPDMVACFTEGPKCHTSDDCKQERISKIARLQRKEIADPILFVGTGTCGLGAGAGKTLEALKKCLSSRGMQAEIVEVGCVGLCSAEPIVDIQLPGKNRVSFHSVTEETVPMLLEHVFSNEISAESLLGQYRSENLIPWPEVAYIDEHPFFAPQTRWVLANCGVIDPNSIEEYMANGGYHALANALRECTPAQLCEMVEKSGLRGRGGGGFLTGKKWSFSLNTAAEQKYLICNADEGDPGAFMDRAVIEGDPHRLLEGMGIAAYSIGATKAYVY